MLIAKKFANFILVASGWLGVLYSPADLWGLPETYPWLGEVTSMLDRFDVLAIFSGLCVLYILWMDLRPFYKKWRANALGPKKKSELADRARLASVEINEIIGEEFKPIKYGSSGSEEDDTRLWREQMHPQEERAQFRYQKKLASECQEIISLASRYVDLDRSEVFFAQNPSGLLGMRHMANLMSRIAAELS